MKYYPQPYTIKNQLEKIEKHFGYKMQDEMKDYLADYEHNKSKNENESENDD